MRNLKGDSTINDDDLMMIGLQTLQLGMQVVHRRLASELDLLALRSTELKLKRSAAAEASRPAREPRAIPAVKAIRKARVQGLTERQQGMLEWAMQHDGVLNLREYRAAHPELPPHACYPANLGNQLLAHLRKLRGVGNYKLLAGA